MENRVINGSTRSSRFSLSVADGVDLTEGLLPDDPRAFSPL